MLDQQRERRARRIPASKNPPRSKPIVMSNEPVEGPADVPAGPGPAKLDTQQGGQRTTVKESARPAKPATDPTVKMSIYLEQTDDLYLEEITHAGKTSRPR